MDKDDFKNLAVEITLKCMDRPFEKWMTFNDHINTNFLSDNKERIICGFHLIQEEIPIVSCKIDSNCLVITTDRVLSKYNDYYYEMNLTDSIYFTGKFDRDNFKLINGRRSKLVTEELEDKNYKKLIYITDSHHPAYFIKTLILNLSSYLVNNKWYLNPSKTYGR